MSSTRFLLRCNAEFSMKAPEIEIGDYDRTKLLDVDSDDESEGNEASE